MRTHHHFVVFACLCLALVACQTTNPLALPTDTPAPPTPTPLPTATPTPAPGTNTGFADFLSQALAARPDQRQDLVNRYLGRLAQTPITGESEAIFLYRGAAQAVQLLGDMNNWDASQAPPLTRLEGSDLWYRQGNFEPDARLDYRFLVNSDQAILDPLNPNTVPGPQRPNSEMHMPAYRQPSELAPAGQLPSGTLSSHTLASQNLDQTHTFQVYEPPGQIIGQAPPSVYINGGSDYLNLINAPAILDSLIAQRQIPPLVAVFVTPINATNEYAMNEAYAAFMAEELVPYVQQRFGTSSDPADTALLGNSLGGLAAVHAAWLHPDVFGLAAAQSGRFAHENRALSRAIGRPAASQASATSPQLYLVVGSYETAVDVGSGRENILEDNRALAEALERAGYDYVIDERPEGHSWGLWRGTLGPALSHLFR